MARRDEVILMLENELDILEKGGLGNPAGQRKPVAEVFENSLACINHWLVPGRTPDVCNGCVLLDFVPPERRQEPHACRFIPLTKTGDTVASLTLLEDQSRLQDAVVGWLRSTIEKLRTQPPDPAGESGSIDY